MIPAEPGMYVIYSKSGPRRFRDKLVAWTDDGYAAVLRDKRLVVVDPYEIKTIDRGGDDIYVDFTQFTPVDDLRTLHRAEDGTLFDVEAIGWGVTNAGDIVPVGLEGSTAISAAGEENYLTTFRERDRAAVYAEALTPKETRS